MVKANRDNDRYTDAKTVEEAKEQCERIIDIAENEMPDRGADFAESVAEKTRKILETIEAGDCVTRHQLTALENMEGGLRRWTERD